MKNNHKKNQSNMDFKIMSFFFKMRDLFKNPYKKISNIDIKKGDHILEYGCGPGSFTIPIAEAVGSSGKVYAADIHPLAEEKIRKKAHKNNLNNIQTINTDCKTNIPDNSIDKVILIDVLHDLERYEDNLQEFYRILKENGALWVDDHHFDGDEIKNRIVQQGSYQFSRNVESLYEFKRK